MILQKIESYKRSQIEEEKRRIPLENLIQEIKSARNFKEALTQNSISIIAEIKKASPSKGIIKENFNLKSVARAYEELDINAISILTEKNFFMGADEYIPSVKAVVSKPILRKDFIIDVYQLFQAKFLGADAVLLIVALLKNNLKEFYKKSKELGLYSIVEVHDEKELGLALEANCEIIGINNRNLKDFTVDLKTTEKLMKYVPNNKIIVSESGIKTSKDILYLRSLGVNAVLIGETFMRNIDNPSAIRRFICSSKR